MNSKRTGKLAACPAIVAACTIVMLFCGADWRQFRGNDSDGLAVSDGPKSLEKTAWSAPLPGRGISGPIVVGDRAYVTASSGYEQDRLHVLACSTTDGAVVWERQFWATGRTQCHPKMAVATPNPASDGRRIVAFYSTNDLACLDRDGNLLWFRGLTYEHPKASNSLGMSSSPVIVDDTVVVQVETDDESFATGIDIANGETRWRLDRPHRANWTSPVVVHGVGGHEELVLLQSSQGLAAVRPRTGEIVWNYNDGASTVSSSTVGEPAVGEPAGNSSTAENRLIVVPSHGLTAFPVSLLASLAPPAGAAAGSSPRWRKTDVSPGYSSPLCYRGRVYAVTGGPILVASDAATGKIDWRLRLKGTIYASPIAASGRLYVVNDEGLARIVTLGPKSGTISSEREFKEGVMGTPAISNGALYVRSEHHLWKIVD